MQNETEDLYTSVVLKLRELIPEFSPKIAVSDCEKAHIFPWNQGIWVLVPFTQAIWKKPQSLGLGKLYKNNYTFANWPEFSLISGSKRSLAVCTTVVQLGILRLKCVNLIIM